jgi:hypothetical protein
MWYSRVTTDPFGRFQGYQAQFRRLPSWGKPVLMVLAIPGIVLAALSILILLVSILALLLLVVPGYRLLTALAGSTQTVEGYTPTTGDEQLIAAPPPPGSQDGVRHVDVRVLQ